MKRIVWVVVVVGGLLTIVLGAQAPDPKAPAISKDVREAVTDAGDRVKALIYARAVLQKELDAATADLNRAAQQAAVQCAATPGYELGPALACVAKEKGKDAPGGKPGGGM